MTPDDMTPGERALTVAVMALVLALLCIRTVGAFVAGHTIHACRWLFPRHPRHPRRPRQ